MKNLSITLIIIVAIVKVGLSQTKNFLDQPYIETSAVDDTSVVPDRIYLDITLTEKDTKGKISVEELEMKMESSLKSIGIRTEEDLFLNDLGSNFNKYFLKDQDVLKIKMYTLIVKDAITAGKVIMELEKIEISNIRIDKTEYSEIEKLKMELKSRAIEKAKLQADFMSNPLGQKVGKALYISDNVNDYITTSLQGRVAGVSIRGASTRSKNFKPVNIQFEKIKVSSTVNVKFILE